MDCYVEWRLALLIFLSTLLGSLLHRTTKGVSKWVGRLFVSEPTECSLLRTQLEQLRVEDMSTTEDSVRLYNLRQSKQSELNKLERDSVQLRKKFQRYMSIFITVLIEIFRISVIILNRHTPVAILSPDMLHPLTAIISFPTGVTGAVGAPIWGLACRQFIAMVTSLYQ